MVHGFCVNEKLEGGAGLVLGGYVVEIPGIVIYVANPCFYFPGVWLHGNESAVHQFYHVTYGIHCAQFLYGGTIVGKDFNGMGEVQVVIDGVLIVGIFLL